MNEFKKCLDIQTSCYVGDRQTIDKNIDKFGDYNGRLLRKIIISKLNLIEYLINE